MSCYLRNKEYNKSLDTRMRVFGEQAGQGESRVDREGSYSPAWVPGCQRKDRCESTTCKV